MSESGTTANVASTSPSDWKYVSEGGSTIVFSYAGPPHPTFDGTALRLRKRPTPAHDDPERYEKPQLPDPPSQDDHGHEKTAPAAPGSLDEGGGDDDDDDEPDDPTIVFQNAVIARLLPREHLPRLESVRVGRAWLEELAVHAEPLRPLERRAADRIDTARRKAVLATDLVGGDGWSVEIKPKWGFLPAPAHLSPATRETKTRTCRFCMHAHLRAAQAADGARGFCPLDLYSGDEARVGRALRALWDAWLASRGAANNLRVFVRGTMLRPAGLDPTALAPLAEQLFAPSPSPDVGAVRPPDALRDAFVAALRPHLVRSPLLRRLARLQRTLDALDVEGLAALWARVRPGTALGAGAPEPDLAEWVRFVDAYLARGGPDADAGDAGETGEEEDEEALRFRLLAYLLSASFKDCSLMFRMRPLADAATTTADEGAVRAQAGTVTVIDLDVKSIGRLAKWAALDREIVDAYRGVPPRDCVDAGALEKP